MHQLKTGVKGRGLGKAGQDKTRNRMKETEEAGLFCVTPTPRPVKGVVGTIRWVPEDLMV